MPANRRRKMKSKSIGTILLTLAASLLLLAAKPNIIVIYTADLGCQGIMKDVKTPNLAAVAPKAGELPEDLTPAKPKARSPKSTPAAAGHK